MRRLPVKARLTLAFAAGMAVLFAGLSISLYTRMAGALLDELDTGLRSRADALVADSARTPDLTERARGLVESNEAFAQLLTLDGRVVTSSPGVPAPLLHPDELARVRKAFFFQRPVRGVPGEARLLAVPRTAGPLSTVAVVGTSMADRTDALHQLAVYLAVGGPVAILLASAMGFVVAGLALRPVEQMRREASAISASGLDHRLSLPAAEDELRRLAATLNDMLGRLDESMQAERRFLDTASHELRNPLTALKAELDLAQSRARSTVELEAAVRSASAEADRLARLADDLLVLARARDGRLPVHRENVSVRDLLEGATNLFRAKASDAGVRIEWSAPEGVFALDPVRMRQALDNLLDNAIRHTPNGGHIGVNAEVDDTLLRIEVRDTGPGFPPDGSLVDDAHLGLAIVEAVASSHGGTVLMTNDVEGGALVTLTVRDQGHGN